MPERHPGPTPEPRLCGQRVFRYERAAFREATAVMDRMRIALSPSPACGTQPAARDELPAFAGQMLLELAGWRAGTRCLPVVGPQPGKGRTRPPSSTARSSSAAVATTSRRRSTRALAILEKSTSSVRWERYRGNRPAESAPSNRSKSSRVGFLYLRRRPLSRRLSARFDRAPGRRPSHDRTAKKLRVAELGNSGNPAEWDGSPWSRRDRSDDPSAWRESLPVSMFVS